MRIKQGVQSLKHLAFEKKHMKDLCIILMFALMLFKPLASDANDLRVAHETVTAQNVTAEVAVLNQGTNGYRIDVIFTSAQSKQYPLGCVSAYSDLHYELRDAKGRVMPIDQSIVDNPPNDAPRPPAIHVRVSRQFSPPDCSRLITHQFISAAWLHKLYPTAPTGE